MPDAVGVNVHQALNQRSSLILILQLILNVFRQAFTDVL